MRESFEKSSRVKLDSFEISAGIVLILRRWQPCPPSWASWQICCLSNHAASQEIAEFPQEDDGI